MLSLNSRILIVYTTKMVANIGPDILCQTLKMALGTAANGEKCATAKDAPRPEFCMPTSMAIAFFFAKFIPNIFPNKYPIKYPKQLCKTTTAKIIKPVSAIFFVDCPQPQQPQSQRWLLQKQAASLLHLLWLAC